MIGTLVLIGVVSSIHLRLHIVTLYKSPVGSRKARDTG